MIAHNSTAANLKTSHGTLFLNVLATCSSWMRVAEWNRVGLCFFLDTFLMLCTLLCSLALGLLALPMQAEKWDLRRQNHLSHTQCGRGCTRPCEGLSVTGVMQCFVNHSCGPWSRPVDEMVKSCNSALHQVYSWSADCEERLFPQQNSPAQWVYSSLHLGR